MIARCLLVGVLVASTVTSAIRFAHAAPRKVLVLPLDGTADAAVRIKLSASIQRLARVVEGDVTSGKTTLNDTATAVGCDPTVRECIERVRKTLGVDELIYGTADTEHGQITIVVHRTGHKTGPQQIRTTIATTDSPDRADPAILPLFTGATSTPPTDTGSGSGSGSGSDATTNPNGPAVGTGSNAQLPTDPNGLGNTGDTQRPVADEPTSRDRMIGIPTAIGGGVMLLIGFALWSSTSSIQNEIDSAPTATPAQIEALEELESKAITRAWAGNFMVLGGLVLGGYGGYLLWRDHKARSAVIAPAPTTDGAGVMLMIRGRL